MKWGCSLNSKHICRSWTKTLTQNIILLWFVRPKYFLLVPLANPTEVSAAVCGLTSTAIPAQILSLKQLKIINRLHVHLQAIRKHFANIHLRRFPRLNTTYWCTQITMGGDRGGVCETHISFNSKNPLKTRNAPQTHNRVEEKNRCKSAGQ